MEQIYKHASQVLVWLGEADDGSERAFAIFRRLLTSLGPVGLRKWRAREARGSGSEPRAGERLPWEHDGLVAGDEQYYHMPLFQTLKPFGIFARRLQKWLPEDAAPHKDDHVGDDGEVIVPINLDHALTACLLVARLFFTRVWIVQEIAVAEEALVCCGADELDWWLLNLAIGYLLTSAFRSIGNEAGIQRVTSISLTRHALRAGKLTPSEPPMSVVLSILQHYRCCGATDKRDKVYALLGVVKHMGVKLEIFPNYSIEARGLYIDLARTALNSTDNLDILAIPHGQDKTLPSWVPDWSDARPQPNLLFPLSTTVERSTGQKRKPYDASAGSTIDTREILPKDRLRLRGYQFDTLEILGAPFRWTDGDEMVTEYNRKVLRWTQTRQKDEPLPQEIAELEKTGTMIPLEFWKTMRQWHAIAMDSAFDPYPFTNETAECALIHTMEGDYLPNGIEEPAKHWKHLWSNLEVGIQAGIRIIDGSHSADDVENFRLPAKLPDSVKDWDAPLYGPGNRRRLARTRLGYLALVGQEAENGDSVILLQGGRTPYIVRRREEGWAFISDAYIHGVMYGEAWDAGRCEDIVFV